MLVAIVLGMSGCGGGGGSSGNLPNGNLVVTTYTYANNNGSYPLWSQVNISPSLSSLGSNSPTFTLISGTLPPGLSLDSSSGKISGQANGTGSYIVTIRLTVSGFTGSIDRSVFITITAPTLSYGNCGGPVGAAISSSPILSWIPPAATKSYQLTAGALPPGLSFDPATGIVSGALTTIGSFTYTAIATISYNGMTQSPQATVDCNVTASGIVVGYPTGLTGNVGTPLSLGPTLFLPHGETVVGYQIKTGSSLPNGLSLNTTTGIISGTPAQAGVSTTTVEAVFSHNGVTIVVREDITFTIN